MSRYKLDFSPDAFRQNFRNLLEDLEGIATSIAGAVLLAGRSGGQQVAGGTVASEDLTLTSNATATKDRIFFGAAQTSAYDELNDRLGIGTPTPVSTSVIHAQRSTDAMVIVLAETTNSAGTSAASAVRAAATVAGVSVVAHGAGRTLARCGITLASWNEVLAGSGNGLLVDTQTSVPIVLGTNNLERLRIDGPGNVSIGTAALATSATDGFLYIPTCAGAPTGVPTAKTGRVPLIYDTTNNKLYIYNGAWESATFA